MRSATWKEEQHSGCQPTWEEEQRSGCQLPGRKSNTVAVSHLRRRATQWLSATWEEEQHSGCQLPEKKSITVAVSMLVLDVMHGLLSALHF